MIEIAGRPASPEEFAARYRRGSTELRTAQAMLDSGAVYTYGSADAFRFELEMRAATVTAAVDLEKSGMGFAVFRKSRCNPAYWNRTSQGGFVLKAGVSPADAIRDIYRNGPMYATECATAIPIIFFRAALAMLPDPLFNRVFPSIRLMNWRWVDPIFHGVAVMRKSADFLPGDRLYFINPDVNPETPEWRGENVILLRPDLFYGHGIGTGGAADIIRELNANRFRGARHSARLLDETGRPDYLRLFRLRSEYAG